MKVRLVAVFAFAVFLITAFRAGWTRMESDFPNYYTAAVLVRKHQPLRYYYDWTWFQRQMNYAGFERQLGNYTPHSPLTMLPMIGLAVFPPQRAKQIWLAFNLTFLAATVWLLSRLRQLPVEQLALMAFCGYGSLYTNFLLGQYYVFLLFLLTLAFYCLHYQNSWTAGFLCGVAFGLKLYGGPFLLYFVVKRNWKAVAGMLVACVCLGGLALWIFGLPDLTYYATQILPRSLEEGAIDPYNPVFQTLPTLLRHVLVREPELNPHPFWNAPWLFFLLRPFLTLAILVFALSGLALNPNGLERRQFAWFMVAVIGISSNTASYTFILLLLPVVLALEESNLSEGVFFIASYVLLTLPLRPVWLFPKVWLMLALYLAMGRPFWRSLRPRFIAAAVVFVALVSVVDARRHLLSYASEPGQRFERIALEKGAIFSSFPAVSRFGVFYQSMGKDRYILRWLRDQRIEELYFEGNAFQPVAPTAGGPINFELVTHRTSTLMQLDPPTLNVVRLSASPSAVAIDSAVSPSGKWIAYTLTEGGAKHVWVRNVGSGKAQALTGGNCNSSSPAWQLDSQAILFASDCGRALGLPALYRARFPADRPQ